MKYYSFTKINAKKATYNVVFGERSNGKTYASLKQAVKEYVEQGCSQFVYVRRWKEDITGRRASLLFAGINTNEEVAKLTAGKFAGVHYFASKFYLCNYDENGKPIYSEGDCIGFTMSLSDGEHDKSTSFPNVRTIIFDEFLTNKTYLVNEFVLFMNLVSTVVRRRDDVKIYMLGNTVNKYCPYFQEMGLDHVAKMAQGSIDIYRYGESKLTVAVEYCRSSADDKEGNKSKHYFAFSNPKLEMITGGAWELNIYPHLPMKYKPADVIMRYFIEFADRVFDCEIIQIGSVMFTYIHDKTTPIRQPDKHLIYSLECRPERNYNRSMFRPTTKAQERVLWFFQTDRVFYQNNEVGDAISNYLKLCKR